MFFIKPKLKITSNDFILISFYLISIIFVRFHYSHTLSLLEKGDIFDIDQGNYLIKNLGIYFLDDSAKFEIFLKEGETRLVFFHGGLGLEFLITILKIIFSKGFLMFGVILINIAMVLDNYFLFRKNINFVVCFLLIPFLTYSTISLNKDIATITTLLTFSYMNSNNLSINSLAFILSPRFYLRLLALIMTTLSRPGLIILVLALYSFFYILQNIIKLKLRININSIILSLIFFSIFLIFLSQNIDDIDAFSKLIFSWWNKENNISLLSQLLGSIFILSVPFPTGFLNIDWIIKGFGDAKFMYFAYCFLSLLGIYRLYLYCCILKFSIIRKFKLESNLINIFVLTITGVLVGISGDSITRQLITIAIPLTITMEVFKNEYFIKSKYQKSFYINK